jgi:DNA-binding HxlR family transcriptional regulator
MDIYVERAACPVYTAIGVIDGRWKPMIIQRLAVRPHGVGQLRRALPTITPKVLREQLKQLTADDVIAREQLVPAVRGVRYRLTPHGRALLRVFDSLWVFGTRHLARRGAEQGTRVLPPRTAALENDAV